MNNLTKKNREEKNKYNTKNSGSNEIKHLMIKIKTPYKEINKQLHTMDIQHDVKC